MTKKDKLGDIVLWSLGIFLGLLCLASLTKSDLILKLAGLAFVPFFAFMAVAIGVPVVELISNLKRLLRKK